MIRSGKPHIENHNDDTAKDMFKAEGYDLIKDHEVQRSKNLSNLVHGIAYTDQATTVAFVWNDIDPKGSYVTAYRNSDSQSEKHPAGVDVGILKAIERQMKELGWSKGLIDEENAYESFKDLGYETVGTISCNAITDGYRTIAFDTKNEIVTAWYDDNEKLQAPAYLHLPEVNSIIKQAKELGWGKSKSKSISAFDKVSPVSPRNAFFDLGYIHADIQSDKIDYSKVKHILHEGYMHDNTRHICFDLDSKRISFFSAEKIGTGVIGDIYASTYIDTDMLQVVNRQVKELGWCSSKGALSKSVSTSFARADFSCREENLDKWGNHSLTYSSGSLDISFDLNSQTIRLIGREEPKERQTINVDTLQAINQRVEELGWVKSKDVSKAKDSHLRIQPKDDYDLDI